MTQQHRLELIFAGPRKQLDELMPKVMATMDGHAGRLHLDAIDLNDLAHGVGAVAQLSWEHRAEMYNILPHEHGFRVSVSQTYEAFSQEAMRRVRARCQQIFCGAGTWRARLIGVEIIARLPPAAGGAETQPAPASASAE